MENFKTNLSNKPQVNHIDGNKFNNNIENLEWATVSENIKHAYKTGLNKVCNRKLTEKDVIFIREKYSEGSYSQEYFAKKYNISRGTIEKIIRGKTWKTLPILYNEIVSKRNKFYSGHKFSDEEVIIIQNKYLLGAKICELSKEFGADRSTIRKVIKKGYKKI